MRACGMKFPSATGAKWKRNERSSKRPAYAWRTSFSVTTGSERCILRRKVAHAGRTQEAEEFFQRAIQAGDVAAYANLGDLFAQMPKRKKDAELAYKNGIKAGSADARNGL